MKKVKDRTPRRRGPVKGQAVKKLVRSSMVKIPNVVICKCRKNGINSWADFGKC